MDTTTVLRRVKVSRPATNAIQPRASLRRGTGRAKCYGRAPVEVLRPAPRDGRESINLGV